MKNILDLPLILGTRKNHAVEHATIHLITRKYPGKAFAGHSNPAGFVVVGETDVEALADTVEEAIRLLNDGKSSLAIHEGCGTNYAVIGGLAALFSVLVMNDANSNKERWARFPVLMLTSIIAFMIGRSIGPMLQKKITTDAKLGGLRVVSISKLASKLHWVHTVGA